MNADDRQELIDNLDSARLAAKWVVDHAHRAHEYDRPYAELVLEHIEEAIRILREPDAASAADELCARCDRPWSEHTRFGISHGEREGCDGFECSKDHDADGSECPIRHD